MADMRSYYVHSGNYRWLFVLPKLYDRHRATVLPNETEDWDEIWHWFGKNIYVIVTP